MVQAVGDWRPRKDLEASQLSGKAKRASAKEEGPVQDEDACGPKWKVGRGQQEEKADKVKPRGGEPGEEGGRLGPLGGNKAVEERNGVETFVEGDRITQWSAEKREF